MLTLEKWPILKVLIIIKLPECFQILVERFSIEWQFSERCFLYIKSFSIKQIKMLQCIFSARKSQFATWLSIVLAWHHVNNWEVTNSECAKNKWVGRIISGFSGKIHHWLKLATKSDDKHTIYFYLRQCYFMSVTKLIDLSYVKYSLVLKPLLANHWPGFP